MLIDGLDEALRYSITAEAKKDLNKLTNYSEQRDKVCRVYDVCYYLYNSYEEILNDHFIVILIIS